MAEPQAAAAAPATPALPTPPPSVVQAIADVFNSTVIRFDSKVVNGPVQAATLAAQGVMSALALSEIAPGGMEAVEDRISEALHSAGVEGNIELKPLAERILAAAFYAPGGVWSAASAPDWTTPVQHRCPLCGHVGPGNIMIDHITEAHGEAAAKEATATREAAQAERGIIARVASLEQEASVKVFELEGGWNVSITWGGNGGTPHEALGVDADLGTAFDLALTQAGK